MVGTREKDVIWHFDIKYDKYFIFLCKVFLFFPYSKKSIQDYSNPGLCYTLSHMFDITAPNTLENIQNILCSGFVS